MVHISRYGSSFPQPYKPLIEVGIQNDLNRLVSDLGGARVQNGEVLAGLPPFYGQRYSVVSGDGFLVVNGKPFIGCDERGIAHFEHHERAVFTDREVFFIPIQPDWIARTEHPSLSAPWELRHRAYGEDGHAEYIASLQTLTGKEVVFRNPRTHEVFVSGTIAGLTADPRQSVTVWFARGSSWAMDNRRPVEVLTVTASPFSPDSLVPLLQRDGNILFENGVLDPPGSALQQGQVVSIIDLSTGRIIHPKGVVTEIQDNCLLLEDGPVIARNGIVIAPHWAQDTERKMEFVDKVRFDDGTKITQGDLHGLMAWTGNGEALVRAGDRPIGSRGVLVGHHTSSTGQVILWLDNGYFVGMPAGPVEIAKFREARITGAAVPAVPATEAPAAKPVPPPAQEPRTREPTPFERRHPVPSGPPKVELVVMKQGTTQDRWGPAPKPKAPAAAAVEIKIPELSPSDSRYEGAALHAGPGLTPGKRYTVIDETTGAVLHQGITFFAAEDDRLRFTTSGANFLALDGSTPRIFRQMSDSDDLRHKPAAKTPEVVAPGMSAEEVTAKLTPGTPYEWRTSPLARSRGTFAGAYTTANNLTVIWLSEGRVIPLSQKLEVYRLGDSAPAPAIPPPPRALSLPSSRHTSAEFPPKLSVALAEKILFEPDTAAEPRRVLSSSAEVEMLPLMEIWAEHKRAGTWPAILSSEKGREVAALVATCTLVAARRSPAELDAWAASRHLDPELLAVLMGLVKHPRTAQQRIADYWKSTDPLAIVDQIRANPDWRSQVPECCVPYQNQLVIVQALQRIMQSEEIPALFLEENPFRAFQAYCKAVAEAGVAGPAALARWSRITGLSHELTAEIELLGLKFAVRPDRAADHAKGIDELKADISAELKTALTAEPDRSFAAVRERAFHGDPVSVIDYFEFLHRRLTDDGVPLAVLVEEQSLPRALYHAWADNLVAFRLEATRAAENHEASLRRLARKLVRETSTQDIETLTAAVALGMEGGEFSSREVLARLGVDPRVYQFACHRAARELLFSRRLAILDNIREQEKLGVARSVLLEEAQITERVLRRWISKEEAYKRLALNQEEFAEQHTFTERSAAREFMRDKKLDDVNALLKSIKEAMGGGKPRDEVLAELNIPVAAYQRLLARHCLGMGWSERLATLRLIERELAASDTPNLRAALAEHQVSGKAYRTWERRREKYERRAELEREKGLAPIRTLHEAADWLRTLDRPARAEKVKAVRSALRAGTDLAAAIQAEEIPSMYAYQRLLRRFRFASSSATRLKHLREIGAELETRGADALDTILQARQIARYTYDKWRDNTAKYEKRVAYAESVARRSEAWTYVRGLTLAEVRSIRTAVLQQVSRGKRTLEEILAKKEITPEAHRLILRRCALATPMKDRLTVVERARELGWSDRSQRAQIAQQLQFHARFLRAWNINYEHYQGRIESRREAKLNSPKVQRAAARRFLKACTADARNEIHAAAAEYLTGENAGKVDECAKAVGAPNRKALLMIASDRFAVATPHARSKLLQAAREEIGENGDPDPVCVRLGVSRRAYNNYMTRRHFMATYGAVVNDVRHGFSLEQAYKRNNISAGAYNKYLYRVRSNDTYSQRLALLQEVRTRRRVTHESVRDCVLKTGLNRRLYEEWKEDRAERTRGMSSRVDIAPARRELFVKIDKQVGDYLAGFGLPADALARWVLDGRLDYAMRYAVAAAKTYQAKEAQRFGGERWRTQEPLKEDVIRGMLVNIRDKVRALLAAREVNTLDYSAWTRYRYEWAVDAKVRRALKTKGR